MKQLVWTQIMHLQPIVQGSICMILRLWCTDVRLEDFSSL